MDDLIGRQIYLHLDLNWHGLYFNGGFPVPRILSKEFEVMERTFLFKQEYFIMKIEEVQSVFSLRLLMLPRWESTSLESSLNTMKKP